MTTCCSAFGSAPAFPRPGRRSSAGTAGGGMMPATTSVHDPDIFNAFGQFISGMARMSKATGDTAILDKASFSD